MNVFIYFVLMQAAVGSVSLDVARQKGFTGQIEEEFTIQVNLITRSNDTLGSADDIFFFSSGCPKKCRTSWIFQKVSISTGLGIGLFRRRK